MTPWYERIIAAHLAVTDQVSHGARMKSRRYFVWQEEGRRDLEAENRHIEKAMSGITDLWTDVELDPWADQLEEALDNAGIAWRRSLGAAYDEERGIWHVQWSWCVYG